MDDQIDWDAIAKKIEQDIAGARAWTFRPVATVEREDDGSYSIDLEWTESYETAWDKDWNELEDTSTKGPPDAIQEEGASLLDKFLNENPDFKGRVASHWRPNEGAILYTCEVCGYTTESKRGLNIHRSKSHDGAEA